MYGVSQLDNDLDELFGKNVYKVHFDKGGTPEVGGFWSITAYDIDGYLEANKYNRYASGSNMDLTYNDDGSLDIYLSNKKPAGVPTMNWVPTPTGKFKLLFRMYWPKESVLNGSWKIPPVEKVK